MMSQKKLRRSDTSRAKTRSDAPKLVEVIRYKQSKDKQSEDKE